VGNLENSLASVIHYQGIRPIKDKGKLVETESILILGFTLFEWLSRLAVGIFNCSLAIIVIIIVVALLQHYIHEPLVKSQKRTSEDLTKIFLSNGIKNTDFPAVIFQCHSCSKIFILTQNCDKCGASAEYFGKTGTGGAHLFSELGTAHGFHCGRCRWGYETATCSCGTENAAVQMGTYVRETVGPNKGNITRRSGITITR